MAFKDQWKKIKDNWMLIAIAIVVIVFMNAGGISDISYSMQKSLGMSESAYDMDYGGSSRNYYPPGDDGFAPDVEDRKIIKTASMNTEVKRGEFLAEQQRLKGMLASADAYLLNEDVNLHGSGLSSYYQGNYQIKVDTKKYDTLVAQLKTIGEVQSFSENTDDVTGTYTNKEIELETEKARLERYERMYEEAEEMEDKINLNDRIFDQERRVKYLEDSLSRIDERVDYTTVRVYLKEKRSGYADIAIVKFSSLVRNLVGSLNAFLSLLFTLLPWALFVLVVAGVWKVVKRRK